MILEYKVNDLHVQAAWLKTLYDLVEELNSVKGDEEAILDRFYRDLEFGTGGLRGVIGAGTNRMNYYTVCKATQGLAAYLKAIKPEGASVAVSYDSRIKSDVFAREAAIILNTLLIPCPPRISLM